MTTVGEMSDLLAWGTASAYAIAFVAFAIDLSGRLGVRSVAREKVLAAATPASGASTVATDVVDPAVRDTTSAGAVSEVTARRAASLTSPWKAWSVSKPLAIAMSVAWMGLALHLAAVVTRGLAAGRAPWANLYEFVLVGAFFAMAVFLVVQTRWEIRFLGTIVSGLSTIAIVVALNAFHVEAAGVQPALQSYWLVIHVGIAVLATGIFTVAFAASVTQLLRDSRDEGSPMLASRTWSWLDQVPTAAQLELLSFRINAVGFVLWTFTIVSGSVWAEDAWGRYWGWDPKEVWSFVIWVVYAAYLHARTTRGWSGRRAAWFVVVGYACVLFNFTGVNLLFSGKHSYSGV
ncbi:c-type cytochrome biogenesis protein CcsB [Sanguibacter massiliensis]|uniref:c-type cytochrome biogenesis protein CcsB n=1 Tax=Sanguibacter massiliensis TaxID=1973217 RepID=UPI000C840F42|nr:c-type cytochrome biogenesis protein CcsB [Sanguibacter massiliensis]